MILASITILSLISLIMIIIFANPMTFWYDFWMLILIFIGFMLGYLLLLIIYIIIYTLSYNKKKGPHPTKFTHRLLKRACEFFCQISKIKINVRGLEKIPTDTKFLCVQNHLSNFDPIVTIWGLRYFDFSFIYKNNIDKVPVVSNFLVKDGHLSLDRQNNRKGLITIANAIKLIENQNYNVFAYPEGTRSKTGDTANFHSGTFKIPEKTKCPLVITVVENTDVVKYRWPFKNTNVYLDVVDVLYYDDYKDINTVDLAELTKQKVIDRLEELSPLKYEVKKKSK